MGIGFAIPVSLARTVLAQIIKDGTVTRGWLGVEPQAITREAAQALALARTDGVLVRALQRDGPADRAGIQVQDVVVEIAGKPTPDVPQLLARIAELTPGSSARIKVVRDGKPLDVVVTLSALDAGTTPGAEPATPAAAEPASGNVLGLAVEELDAAARAALGLKAGEGVLVARVAGLAARRAGVVPGDVILQVNKATVGSVADFEAAVKDLSSGDEVRLLVRNARSTGFVTFQVR